MIQPANKHGRCHYKYITHKKTRQIAKHDNDVVAHQELLQIIFLYVQGACHS
jgi:hypothetical protein